MIHFRCVRCQHPLKINERAAGQQLYCPVCYHQLTVPAESTIKEVDHSQLYEADEKPIDVREMRHRREFASLRCKICLADIAVRKEQIGQEVVCPDCGTKMIVPPEIAAQIDALLNDTLDKIMQGLGDDSGKDIYGVSDGTSRDDGTGRIPVHCTLCHTLMYAADEQIGTELMCPDCGTKTVVPPRPQQKPLPPPLPRRFEGGSTFGIAPDGLASTEPLVPVVCELCATRMYARQSQIGEFKTCPDCGRQTLIKAVPKEELAQPEPPGDAYAVNITEPPPRPMFRTLTDYRYVDGSLNQEHYSNKPPEEQPMRPRIRGSQPSEDEPEEISRETLMERRKRQLAAEYLPRRNRPLPNRPLTEGLLTPIFTWRVIVRTMLSTMLACFAILVGILCPGLFIIISLAFGGFLFILWAALQTNFCWSVFHFSVDGDDEFEDWFGFSFVDSLGLWFWIFCYSILAAVPGYFFASWLPGDLFVQSITADGRTVWVDNPSVIIRDYVLIRLSHWIFFPFFFLSCMETGSYFTPCATRTLQTFARYTGIWMRFYALTAVIILLPDFVFIGLFRLALYVCPPEILAVPFVVLGFFGINFCSILFFRLLGRLAWVLEENVRREQDEEE